MKHIKTYRYVPKRWMAIALEAMLFLMMVAYVILWIYAPHTGKVIHRVGPIIFFGALSLIFVFPIYMSFQREYLLLGRNRIVVPVGITLRKRVAVRYAQILRLRVEKVRLTRRQWPLYSVMLFIDYEEDGRQKMCRAARSYFPSKDAFNEMCACLSDNVCLANPEYVHDPFAIGFVPRSRLV